MIPTLLITLREVIEASLIVATILGILTKLGQKKEIKTVWLATFSAALVSIGLLGVASLLGVKVQSLYTGAAEAVIEGILMIASAIFITWAVFFLHSYFGRYKTNLLVKLTGAIGKHKHKGLFLVAFTAVFREGFEIVLFLSTIYLSSNPTAIFTGFSGGAAIGLLISFGLFKAAIRMPVYYAFRVTSVLLILFAAGLLARGVHEFAEIGMLPEISNVSIAFLPATTTFIGDVIKALFGITKHMDLLQLSVYLTYIYLMHRKVFVKSARR